MPCHQKFCTIYFSSFSLLRLLQLIWNQNCFLILGWGSHQSVTRRNSRIDFVLVVSGWSGQGRVCFLGDGKSYGWERLEFYCNKKGKRFIRYPSRTNDSERNEYANLANKATKLHTLPTLEESWFPFNSKKSKDIDRWVEFAAEKQVKKLKLDFCNKVYLDDEPYNSFLASQESN